METIIRLEGISKKHITKDKTINVLPDLMIDFKSNTYYAIIGYSGSGKSTLINILGLIENFDKGKYDKLHSLNTQLLKIKYGEQDVIDT